MKKKLILASLLFFSILCSIILVFFKLKDSSVLKYSPAITNYRINPQIGAGLVENGIIVTTGNEGTLLQNLLINDEKFKVGKKYDEKISIKNTGNMSMYVRVTITKTWSNIEGNKDTSKSPDLIKFDTNDEWIYDNNLSNSEKVVLYYPYIVEPEQTTSDFITSLWIDNSIKQEIKERTLDSKNGCKTIETFYDYNNCIFNLKITIDYVQSELAEEAILYAWGVNVEIDSNGTIISVES